MAIDFLVIWKGKILKYPSTNRQIPFSEMPRRGRIFQDRTASSMDDMDFFLRSGNSVPVMSRDRKNARIDCKTQRNQYIQRPLRALNN